MRKEYDFSQGQRGAVLPSSGKTGVTIMLDDDAIEAFLARAEAAGQGQLRHESQRQVKDK